jgi:hypothetical protein
LNITYRASSECGGPQDGGPDLKTAYITLLATGKLVAIEWPRPGLKLHYNA